MLTNKQSFELPYDYNHIFNDSERFTENYEKWLEIKIYNKNDKFRFRHLIEIGLIDSRGTKTKAGKWWDQYGRIHSTKRHIER